MSEQELALVATSGSVSCLPPTSGVMTAMRMWSCWSTPGWDALNAGNAPEALARVGLANRAPPSG